MRQMWVWSLAAMLVVLNGCSADEASAGSELDAVDDGESVDWKPSGKDASLPDVAVGTDGSEPIDATANDVADVSDVKTSDIIWDIGGGLPSEITAITPSSDLFDPGGIHEIALTLAPADWAAYLDGVDKPDGQKVYNWYQADAVVDGLPYKTLGIKGFGNGSQIDNPAKPNVRLKFDQYLTEGMGPQGEKAFRLKASGQDPTYVREPISGAMLRAVGGSGPRFSWAHVTINGVDFGPYIIQESVDKRYFHIHFGNNDGGKFEPLSGCYGIDCPVAGGCAALKPIYVGSPGDSQLIVDVAQAITDATDDQLPGVLDTYFYTDELLADYAVDAILSNIDGFAAAGQNFTFYSDEITKKLHLIATGVDLTFGNFGKPWYELATPWGAPNSWCAGRVDQLYERIWKHPVLKPKLLAKFRTLQCGMFKDTILVTLVESYHIALKPFIYNEPKGIYTPKQVDAYFASVEDYIVKRQKTLSDLLGPCN